MEKNNDLNKSMSEFDFLCLKDHLNASFDEDNISISDDLINRTIQAAKENASPEVNSFEIKKKYKFPIRGFVQAAAAILFVLVFFNFASNFRMSKDSSESTSEAPRSAANDTAAKTDDIPFTSQRNNVTEEEVNLFQEKTTEETAAAMDEAQENTADNVMEKEFDAGDTMTGLAGDLQTASFVDLYTVSEEQVQSFTLTSKAEEGVMGDAEHVKELFTILNAYFITPGDKNISSVWNYKIEFSTDEAQTFTIWIGDGIQIKQVDDVTETEIYYSLENKDDLLARIEEFYKNLSEN